MKKTILAIMLLLIATTGCNNSNLTVNEYGVPDLKDDFKLNTKESNECEYEIKKYYNENEQKVYLACLDEVTLNIDNLEISLKNYLKDYGINNGIEGITKKLEMKDALNDGGTIIYWDGETTKYSNNGITIVKCNTVHGNNDVYIGNANLDYNWGFRTSEFCK